MECKWNFENGMQIEFRKWNGISIYEMEIEFWKQNGNGISIWN